jgi:hypothetical protein
VGGEAPVTPVLSLDSSYLNPSYKPCDNSPYEENIVDDFVFEAGINEKPCLDENHVYE